MVVILNFFVNVKVYENTKDILIVDSITELLSVTNILGDLITQYYLLRHTGTQY